MLSKSLIQFSVDGRGCVPSLFFVLRPNYVGGNEDNSDLLQKAPCTDCHTQCPQPSSRPPQPMPLPETPGHSQASLGWSLVGSVLLSPGFWYSQGSLSPHRVCCPLLYKFWQHYGGLMGTSSKRAYGRPRSAAPRAPAPAAAHCSPVPPQETPKHSSVSVSVGSLGPGAYKVLFVPFECLFP